MSDRIKGFVVTLQNDLKDEDAKVIQIALMAIKGVIGASPCATNIDDYMNRERVKYELVNKLYDILK